MVVSHQVQEAVNEESADFTGECVVIHGRLSFSGMKVYHYIAQQCLSVPGYFFDIVEYRERQHIGCPVNAPVKVVELFHAPVIDKQDPEFSFLRVERS